MNHNVVSSADVIRTAEACEILGVSEASIARWVESGYLPVLRRGTRGVEPHLFDRSEVAALADRRADAKAALNWQKPALA